MNAPLADAAGTGPIDLSGNAVTAASARGAFIGT